MQDVADYLNVPLNTIRRWRQYGQGPRGYKIGRAVKFRLTEVDAWLAQHRELER